MGIENLQAWLDLTALPPWAQGLAVFLASSLALVVARYLIARSLVYLAKRTENKYDDIIIASLRPFRFTWIAPLLVLYYFASLLPEGVEVIRQALLFLILWLVLITLNSLLNAVNTIYEASSLYRGQSIQGYLDLGKVVLILVGIILTISLFTGQSPVALLSGLGAVMAILVLVFRDTLLSFVASLQIYSNDLVKEGDWIEMPAYEADGEVINIALHTIKVQNWDKTITVIPTYKLLDTPYRNWRGMQESGGRRIKRAIYIDMNTIRFCDQGMLDRFKRIDLVRDYIETRLAEFDERAEVDSERSENAFDEQSLTNVSVFRAYVANYLKGRQDIHQSKMDLLVRQLDPGTTGLPLEVYAFTKTVNWVEYEAIQADIFEHLIAAAPQFDLRVFQQPTGVDFQALVGSEPSEC
jgi:miniconductance mechanosensitive channel